MSVPDPAPPRKPRRLGLYLPFVIALVGVAIWSGVWVWTRGKLEEGLETQAERLRAAGYELSWSEAKYSGYPFRQDIILTEARIRDQSGWALATPRLEAEANMLSPGRWMLATPEGLTFTRPRGGPVSVKGKLLRASLRSLDKTPPAFSFEGVALAFEPDAGAQPFALAKAERVEFHLRPGPDDEGGVFLKVEKGLASPASLLGRVSDGKPVALAWNSTLSRMSDFHGETWAEAVRRWSGAGGQIDLREAGVTAGDAALRLQPGKLTVGADGRLRGSLDITLSQAPMALDALGASGAVPPAAADAARAVAAAREEGPAVRARLTFEAGRTTFGPVAIAPAPKIY
jgi:hypothetical protein